MSEGQVNNEQPAIATGEKIGEITVQRGTKGEYYKVPVWSVPDPLDSTDTRPFVVTNKSKTKEVVLDLEEQAAAEAILNKQFTFETAEALEQKRKNKGKRAPYVLASELNK